jgi:hypothetical protein
LCVRREVQLEIRKQLARSATYLTLVEEGAHQPRFASEEHVGTNVEVLRQVQFLVDECDSQTLCSANVGNASDHSLVENLALRGLMHPSQALHQGTLPGTVLPHHGNHFAGRELCAYCLKRAHHAEAFADRASFQQRL